VKELYHFWKRDVIVLIFKRWVSQKEADNTQHSRQTYVHAPRGFRTMPVGERPQTTLDRAATGIGALYGLRKVNTCQFW
jgi:hypothetical protein